MEGTWGLVRDFLLRVFGKKCRDDSPQTHKGRKRK